MRYSYNQEPSSYFDTGTAELNRLNNFLDTLGKDQEAEPAQEPERTFSFSPQVEQALQRATDMASKLGVHIYT